MGGSGIKEKRSSRGERAQKQSYRDLTVKVKTLVFTLGEMGASRNGFLIRSDLCLLIITLAIVKQTDAPVRKLGRLGGCCNNPRTSGHGLNPGGGNGDGYIDLPFSQRWK